MQLYWRFSRYAVTSTRITNFDQLFILPYQSLYPDLNTLLDSTQTTEQYDMKNSN